jgi:hypothetical protein
MPLVDKVRSAADRIRDRVNKTFEDIIKAGNDLLAVKEALPHGQFLPWLKAECGWSEWSAKNFTSVAEKFKSAKIADLPIRPSAAYLLAAPAVPDEAREKAEGGEQITFATAREIVAEVRKKKRPRRPKALSCRSFKNNAARLQLFALAYNLANALRQLVLPKPIRGWTLTTLRQKLIKIGAKVVRHSKYVLFQLAEVAVPRKLFARILGRIARLCPACASG